MRRNVVAYSRGWWDLAQEILAMSGRLRVREPFLTQPHDFSAADSNIGQVYPKCNRARVCSNAVSMPQILSNSSSQNDCDCMLSRYACE